MCVAGMDEGLVKKEQIHQALEICVGSLACFPHGFLTLSFPAFSGSPSGLCHGSSVPACLPTANKGPHHPVILR